MTVDRPGPGRPSAMPIPTDPGVRESWLHVRLQRCSPTLRHHFESLLSWTNGTSEFERTKRAATVEHLHALIDELWQYRDEAVTARQAVDRNAAHKAEDLRRAEDGRKALLSGIGEIEQTIDRIDLDQALGQTITRRDLMSRLRAATSYAHDLHKEAWEI